MSAPRKGGPLGPTLWDEAHLRLAIDAAGVALWSWNVETDRLRLDGHGFQLWGLDWTEEVSFADLSAQIHPADRDRVRAAFAATRGIVGAYEIDFRIMVSDEVRWISARGEGSDAGKRTDTMFGVFLDVTGRKQAEEGHELMAGEMSHRVKNLLTIASALTTITARAATSAQDMATELTQRLAALGRAHDLVRPIPGRDGKVALLGDLLTILLAPYDDLGAFTGRIRVGVPRMGVGEHAATNIALVIHELATNSMKYGALSAETGTLDVSCDAPGTDVVIVWTERGGPPVDGPGDKAGYGSTVILDGMTRQLGGSLAYNWEKAGVIVTLTINRDRLAL